MSGQVYGSFDTTTVHVGSNYIISIRNIYILVHVSLTMAVLVQLQ